MLVLGGGELTPEFKEGNQREDLPLSRLANSVPKGRGVSLGGEWASIHLHGPGELDAIGMDNVSLSNVNTMIFHVRTRGPRETRLRLCKKNIDYCLLTTKANMAMRPCLWERIEIDDRQQQQ